MKYKFLERPIGKAGALNRTEYVLETMLEGLSGGDEKYNGGWIRLASGNNPIDCLQKYNYAGRSGYDALIDFGPSAPRKYRMVKREIYSEITEYIDPSKKITRVA